MAFSDGAGAALSGAAGRVADSARLKVGGECRCPVPMQARAGHRARSRRAQPIAVARAAVRAVSWQLSLLSVERDRARLDRDMVGALPALLPKVC